MSILKSSSLMRRAVAMPASKRLIVNADGYGFGRGATQGIADAIREGGIITSISVLANFPEAEGVAEIAREYPHISIGVHLNPIVGRPCLPRGDVASLATKEGYFRHREFLPMLKRGEISSEELEAEFDAQIARVTQWAGESVTHIDSQSHSHLHYFDLFLRIARRWRLRCARTNASLIGLETSRPLSTRMRIYFRRPHIWLGHTYRRIQMRRARCVGLHLADRLITVGYGSPAGKTREDNWLRVLGNVPPGTYEMFCHPAYPDVTLRRWAKYCDERALELAVVRRPRLREAAHNCGVQLISFFDL